MDPNPNSSDPQSMGFSFSVPSSPSPQTLDSSPGQPSSASNSPEIEESLPPDAESGEVPTEGVEGGGEGAEEEEEGECGFCLFMKAGGCRDSFVAWEKCIRDAEDDGDDVAERCFEVTSMLKKCMDAHADYYEPILSAEKAMADSISEDAENERSQEEPKKDLGVEAVKVEVEAEKQPEAEEVKVEVKKELETEKAEGEVITITVVESES